MARFLHLADARNARHIQRDGLLPSRIGPGVRAVFCVPVVANFSKTFQWARELRAIGARSLVAVFFEVPDREVVSMGRFNTKHENVTAADAHAALRLAAGPEGQKVLVQRRIEAGEIRALKPAPRLMGWRYHPQAKGQELFYALPGLIKAARRRAVLEQKFASSWSKLPPDPHHGRHDRPGTLNAQS